MPPKSPAHTWFPSLNERALSVYLTKSTTNVEWM